MHCCAVVGCFFLLTSAATTSTFFFFNDTATTEIYTLSLHDALPIWVVEEAGRGVKHLKKGDRVVVPFVIACGECFFCNRSEEHTSELQSHLNLVCRLLLEKKKKLKDYKIQNL